MTYSISPRVAHVVWQRSGESTPAVYVAPLVDGPALVLEGTAALIWLSAVTAGADDRPVVTRVAASVGQEASAIEAEVTSFLRQLCDLGVLTERGQV